MRKLDVLKIFVLIEEPPFMEVQFQMEKLLVHTMALNSLLEVVVKI